LQRPKRTAPGLTRQPRQERSEQTVQRILQATLSLLAREGVEALTTNKVAEEAGMSVASLYRFFPNKQAVIYAAYGEWIEELSTQVNAAVDRWAPALRADPGLWPGAAIELADILGDSRRGARAEYELLRAMFSHRDLRERDDAHTRALAERVAELMALAGADGPPGALVDLAAFANEQFTLAAELAGRRPEPDGQAFAALARATYLTLWDNVLSGAGSIHDGINPELAGECK
jgi:AcrR family transcriptional regulator